MGRSGSSSSASSRLWPRSQRRARLARMLDFGVTVLPDPPYSRWLELLQVAEKHGFGYPWTYDSHVLWQESVPLPAGAARGPAKIQLGRLVRTPGSREPTV